MSRRHRLVLLCHAHEHGREVVPPGPDPADLERRAWAYLRESLAAYYDRSELTPERVVLPVEGVELRVWAKGRYHPVAVVHLRASVVEVERGEEAG